MRVTDWPLHERPRERLLKQGPEALSDAELLAIFLRTGVKGKTVLDVSRILIGQFGNLRNLLAASCEEFCQHPGLGPAKYAQLQAAKALIQRCLNEHLEHRTAFLDIRQVKDFLLTHLQHLKREVFACLFLDTQHRLIQFEKIFYGTIDSAHVHPREIVKRALELNACSVILAHNHPSGVITPSQSDKYITQRICKALALVELKTVDHMIVGKNAVLSFAELGLLPG